MNIVLLEFSALFFSLLGLILSVWLMLVRPFNPVSMVAILTSVFGLLPAILYYYGASPDLFYAWRSFIFTPALKGWQAEYAVAINIIAMMQTAWAGGALLSILFARNNKARYINAKSDQPIYSQYSYDAIQNIIKNQATPFVVSMLILIWLASMAYFFSRHSGSIIEFFMPVKQTGRHLDQSGYMKAIYMFIPLLLFLITYWRDQKISKLCWFWLFLAFVSAFSSHQRRELVTALLFVFGVHIYLGGYLQSFSMSAKEYLEYSKERTKKLKSLTFRGLLFGVMLVPGLWYARVFFTSLSRGDNVNPFEVRSFWEVLFGSPSTGFPTFMLTKVMVEDYGFDWLYTPFLILTLPIPRGIWSDKPETIDNLMQSRYLLLENPSIFWFAELLFNYNIVGIAMAGIIGYWLFRFCDNCWNSPNIFWRSMGAVFFAQAVTLFKNGFSIAGFNIAMFVFLMLACFVMLGGMQLTRKH